MTDESANPGGPAASATSAPSLPPAVDRATFQAELDALRVREKAHTREGDAIAAARRRLPMVEMDPGIPLTGPHGPLTLLDAFEGRRQLIAYYFMWNPGRPAAEQCEGCTFYTTQVSELSYLHSRDITYAVFCQGAMSRATTRRRSLRRERPLPRLHGLGHALVLRARIPRRAPGRAPDRLVPPRVLPAGRRPRLRNLLDETPRRRGNGLQLRAHGPHVYGRQEPWEDSPPGWPQQCSNTRTNGGSPAWPPVSEWPGGRPIAQWPRLEAGRSDDLAVGS